MTTQKEQEERARELQEIHNQGQRDGANVEYNEPHPYTVGSVLFGIFKTDEEIQLQQEDNDAYAAGNKNGFDQI